MNIILFEYATLLVIFLKAAFDVFIEQDGDPLPDDHRSAQPSEKNRSRMEPVSRMSSPNLASLGNEHEPS